MSFLSFTYIFSPRSSLEDDLQSGTGNSVTIMDHDEKRMRRQIANSNERRRMQSINAGFQSLRNLLPHHEGEKLSKVGVFKNVYHIFLNFPLRIERKC